MTERDFLGMPGGKDVELRRINWVFSAYSVPFGEGVSLCTSLECVERQPGQLHLRHLNCGQWGSHEIRESRIVKAYH